MFTFQIKKRNLKIIQKITQLMFVLNALWLKKLDRLEKYSIKFNYYPVVLSNFCTFGQLK